MTMATAKATAKAAAKATAKAMAKATAKSTAKAKAKVRMTTMATTTAMASSVGVVAGECRFLEENFDERGKLLQYMRDSDSTLKPEKRPIPVHKRGIPISTRAGIAKNNHLGNPHVEKEFVTT